MPWPASELAARVPPALLDEVVVEYLVHHGHTNTASALLASRAQAPTRTLLAPRQLAHVAARQDVCRAIVDGALERALELCEAHFPGMLRADVSAPAVPAARTHPPSAVSLDPFHVWLNLHLQLYVEQVRALYADYARGAAPDSPAQQAALAEIQLLHARVQTLPADERAVYAEQIHALVALLAYTGSDARDPARAALLDPARRTALAAQVNSAALAYVGLPPEPVLAYVARQTACVLDALHTQQVRVPREHPLVALMDDAQDESHSVPPRSPAHSPHDRRSDVRGDARSDAHASAAPSDGGVVLPPWDAVGLFAA